MADVEVGANVGAKRQTEEAEAAKQVAQASAESRRAMAVAQEQEMKARIAEMKAKPSAWPRAGSTAASSSARSTGARAPPALPSVSAPRPPAPDVAAPVADLGAAVDLRGDGDLLREALILRAILEPPPSRARGRGPGGG